MGCQQFWELLTSIPESTSVVPQAFLYLPHTQDSATHSIFTTISHTGTINQLVTCVTAMLSSQLSPLRPVVSSFKLSVTHYPSMALLYSIGMAHRWIFIQRYPGSKGESEKSLFSSKLSSEHFHYGCAMLGH